MADECIWIADSNLFHSPYNRRFLFGVSAWTGLPIGLVPALLDGNEVPVQIAYGLASKQHPKNDDLMDFIGHKTAKFLDEEVARGVMMRRCEIDTADLREAKGAIPPSFSIFRRDPVTLRAARDYDILTQALAAGCSFVATSNIRSISHDRLNALVRTQFGRNDDFVGTPDIIAERLLDPAGPDEAMIIAAMSVTDRERSSDAEMNSWNRFQRRLSRSFPATATCAQEALSSGTVSIPGLIERGRGAIRSNPRFEHARGIESRLLSLRLDTLEEARDRGLCELTARERDDVERHRQGGTVDDEDGKGRGLDL